MLTTLNCFLLFQVILVIFVPYFYPGENFGAILGYFFVLGGASVGHSGNQTKCRRRCNVGHSGTQWDTMGQNMLNKNNIMTAIS